MIPTSVSALPVHFLKREEAKASGDGFGLAFNISMSVFLVLLGGVFAGLTLGLMGQDEVHLQVLEQSGDPHERKAATKVLKLLHMGKHWVLVTLLLSNVITNESLPIVLDRCLGGGWPAIVSSTAAIVVFGEIIPQSLTVRYGLGISAAFAPFVKGLMYFLLPIAYPIAKILDLMLGSHPGRNLYKRQGLKTLVGLHKSMPLSQDEVTIISAVLDLKLKPAALVMTPIDQVYTLPSNCVLDQSQIEKILASGYSRIPVHAPKEPLNFVGMLLVRTLVAYDAEHPRKVSELPLAILPETGPETSCLNILNYFQEGKAHMVVVSDQPGAETGARGVLTLEDVIEELIGEEISDESDLIVGGAKVTIQTPNSRTIVESRVLVHGVEKTVIEEESDSDVEMDSYVSGSYKLRRGSTSSSIVSYMKRSSTSSSVVQFSDSDNDPLLSK